MFANCPSVRPFGRYQSREHDILKRNAPILLKIVASGPRGKEMKYSTFGVMRSKVKVTQRLC